MQAANRCDSDMAAEKVGYEFSFSRHSALRHQLIHQSGEFLFGNTASMRHGHFTFSFRKSASDQCARIEHEEKSHIHVVQTL